MNRWLRANLASKNGAFSGVDREAKMIRGFVLAEEGPFKSDGRGEFDAQAIGQIAAMVNASSTGLKSRFSHPGLSADGLGKYLGRVGGARVSREKRERADGSSGIVSLVRGDLRFADSAFSTPSGNLADYVMTLAEEDPQALGSSLVIEPEEKYRLDKKGRPIEGEDGEPLPPLWYPKRLHASDVVDDGDAVHGGLLSSGSLDVERLPDHVVRQMWRLLDRQFPGRPAAEIRERCHAALERYLSARYSSTPAPAKTPKLDAILLRLDEMSLTVRRRNG